MTEFSSHLFYIETTGSEAVTDGCSFDSSENAKILLHWPSDEFQLFFSAL